MLYEWLWRRILGAMAIVAVVCLFVTSAEAGWRHYRYNYSTCRYEPYTPKKTYKKPTTIGSQTEGWRAKFAEIVAEREKSRARIDESANEHNEYMEAAYLHGLQNDPRIAPELARINRSSPFATGGGRGGGLGNLGSLGNLFSGRVAPNGTSDWVLAPYSVTANTYRNFDPNQLADKVAEAVNGTHRLAKDVNDGAKAATQGAMALTDGYAAKMGAIIDRHVAAEETEAKGRAAAMVAASAGEAVRAEPRMHIEAKGSKVVQLPGLDAGLRRKLGAGLLDNAGQIIKFRCVVCHNPNGEARKLDFTDPKVIEQHYDAILQALADRSMPPQGRGTMSERERLSLIGAMTGIGVKKAPAEVEKPEAETKDNSDQ